MAQRGKIGFNIILTRQVTMISKNRKGQRQETIDLEVETVMLHKKNATVISMRRTKIMV